MPLSMWHFMSQHVRTSEADLSRGSLGCITWRNDLSARMTEASEEVPLREFLGYGWRHNSRGPNNRVQLLGTASAPASLPLLPAADAQRSRAKRSLASLAG